MTGNNTEFWQMSILTDTNQSILLVINKNESVRELFKKFLEKYRIYRRQSRLTFLSAEGSELEETDDRRLADVNFLRDKCNIRLIVHADGGGWPTEEEIVKQRRDPSKVPTLTGSITNDLPDIMGMYDDSPRVKMSCGHAIAPTSLALYCYNQLDNGAHSIKCPDCSTVWSFKWVIDAACLSLDETDAFEQRMISNVVMNKADDIKECPGCGNFVRRLKKDRTRTRCMKCSSDKDRKYEFCWTCLNEWRSSKKSVWCGNPECGDHTALYQCLANCEPIILNGIECPSRRACPDCLMLIEHKDKCKHMKCPSKRCKYEFCFICLQHYPCETGIMGAHKPCTLAPRQDSKSLRPPSPTTSDCVIL